MTDPVLSVNLLVVLLLAGTFYWIFKILNYDKQ